MTFVVWEMAVEKNDADSRARRVEMGNHSVKEEVRESCTGKVVFEEDQKDEGVSIQWEQRPWGSRAPGPASRPEWRSRARQRRAAKRSMERGRGPLWQLAGHRTEMGFTLGEKGSCWKVLNITWSLFSENQSSQRRREGNQGESRRAGVVVHSHLRDSALTYSILF